MSKPKRKTRGVLVGTEQLSKAANEIKKRARRYDKGHKLTRGVYFIDNGLPFYR